MQQILHFLAPTDIEFILHRAHTSCGWTRGRQNTGYDVLSIKHEPAFSGLIQRALLHVGPYFEDFYDAYLLRYQVGDYIPPHRDEAALAGKRHHRLNAMAACADEGGELLIQGRQIKFPLGTAIDFFPDEEEHAVTRVIQGQRLLFSVGCWQ